MKNWVLLPICALFAAFVSCGVGNGQTRKGEFMDKEKESGSRKEIYLAGGCFWGTEHFMRKVDGVIDTEAGYANSKVPRPSYSEVCSGLTDAAETVKVVYDPDRVSLPFLLHLYFMTIDPLSVNRQGNDVGTQYRTGIYYVDADDEAIIDSVVRLEQNKYSESMAVEIMALRNFYPAEDYHQDYLVNNPGGYCHVSPELISYASHARETPPRFVKAGDAELRNRLTEIQYEVTRNNATERPYDNEYYDEFRPGIYVDITTGQPLFVSTDKFESGCGWPAFSKPISDSLIVKNKDLSHGMVRTEVRSALGDSHLGHVFPDGPSERGGLRYCINSASLRFIPAEKMVEEGYLDYLKLL